MSVVVKMVSGTTVHLTVDGGAQDVSIDLKAEGGCVSTKRGRDDVSLHVDGAIAAVRYVDNEPVRPMKRLRARTVEDDDDDDSIFGSDSDDDGPFTVRIGDVALIKLEKDRGRLLVTEVNTAAQTITGYWLYSRDELPKPTTTSARWILSLHEETNPLDSVEETCRPLDWLLDTNDTEPAQVKLDKYVYDPGRKRFDTRLMSEFVMGWAAAAHTDPDVVRENILNQVGPLLGKKYGPIMDELALCGSASRAHTPRVKQAVIIEQLPITKSDVLYSESDQPTPRRSLRTGVCWACTTSKPLAASIGEHRIGATCASKLERLQALVAELVVFLTAPFEPESALEFTERANQCLAAKPRV